MTLSVSPEAVADLQQRYQQFRDENPQLRIRNAADALGVSELELVALNCGPEGFSVQRLDSAAGQFRKLLSEVRELGSVMALTRNDTVVHEKTAPYGKLGGGEQVGLFLGEIDLRVFFERWHYGFHVTEGERRSLQFFDATGTAVHKIYANDQTDMAAFDALVARYIADDQSQGAVIDPEAVAKQKQSAYETVADDKVDIAAFHQDWDGLQDVHDFLALLKKHALERQQAFRLAGTERAEPLAAEVFERALEMAAEQEMPVMIFAANKGMVQIHTGQVKRLMRRGPWFNVLDPDFNLHANTEAFAQAWKVVRPTEDGPVSSLELFDNKGQLALQMFGARKPGQQELNEWQMLLSSLES